MTRAKLGLWLSLLAVGAAVGCGGSGGGGRSAGEDADAVDSGGDVPGDDGGLPERNLDSWTLRRHLAPLFSVAFGNGQYVAVGSDGLIQRSTDGQDWQVVRPASDLGPLRGVTFGNGRFVAVGELGHIRMSIDGTTWTDSTYSRATPLSGVAFGNGVFVAVGAGGAVATSPDGATWAQGSTGVDVAFNDVIYAADLFVAVGGAGVVVTSTDGVEWHQRHAFDNSTELLAVTWGAGHFVATGTAGPNDTSRLWLTSDDGTTWTDATEANAEAFNGLAYGNPRFVAVGGETVPALASSADGQAWAPHDLVDARTLNGVAFGDAGFVAVGDRGLVATSSGGESWTAATPPAGNGLASVAFGAGAFVAVGPPDAGPSTLRSTDGMTWTRVDNDICAQTQSPGCAGGAEVDCPCTGLRDVTAGPAGFVAVGPQAIALSADGSAWSRVATPSQALGAVAASSDAYVAVGAGGLVETSADGQSWSPHTVSPAADLVAVAYGAGVWVAAGSTSSGAQAAVLTSADGASWTPVPGDPPNLVGLTFGSDLFVGVAATTEAVFTSPDGVNWTQQAFDANRPRGLRVDLRDVTNAGGTFVAGGDDGLVMASADGLAWHPVDVPVVAPLEAVAFGHDEVVAVGDEELILTSP